jgi:histone-lysine N-methyltransferase SUV39H
MAVVSDRANKHLHDLCFFALEDITRLTELTFDYFAGTTGEEEDGMTIEQQARAKQEKGEITTKCLCGADNCRGWLW